LSPPKACFFFPEGKGDNYLLSSSFLCCFFSSFSFSPCLSSCVGFFPLRHALSAGSLPRLFLSFSFLFYASVEEHSTLSCFFFLFLGVIFFFFLCRDAAEATPPLTPPFFFAGLGELENPPVSSPFFFLFLLFLTFST